jgi:hypothetical protein
MNPTLSVPSSAQVGQTINVCIDHAAPNSNIQITAALPGGGSQIVTVTTACRRPAGDRLLGRRRPVGGDAGQPVTPRKRA